MKVSDELWQKLSNSLSAVKTKELALLISYGFSEVVARAALQLPYDFALS